MGGGRRRLGQNPTTGGRTRGGAGGRTRGGAGGGRRGLSGGGGGGGGQAPQNAGRARFLGGKKPGSRPSHAVDYACPSADAAGGAAAGVGVLGPRSWSRDPAVAGGVGLGFTLGEDAAVGEEEEVVDCGPVVGRVGLGFSPREEEEEDEEVEEGSVGMDLYSTPKVKGVRKNEGFLSIGGLRVYTEDTSSPEEEIDGSEDDDSDDDEEEEEEEEDDDEEEGGVPMEEDEEEDAEDEEEDSSDEDDSTFNGDSDIDDEVAEDYLEGIGGSAKLLSSRWPGIESSDESDDDDGLPKPEKLGGIALMNASEKYGMKPKLMKGKGKVEDDMCVSPAVGLFPRDDYMLLAKDVRSSSRRKKPPPSSSSHLSRSWPCELRKSKRHGSVPGTSNYHSILFVIKLVNIFIQGMSLCHGLPIAIAWE